MTVTLEQAKLHLRVTHDTEDTLIAQYLSAAVGWVERYTGKLLDVAEVVDTFTAFGDYLELRRGPLVSITSVGYTDSAGDEQVLADTRLSDGRIYAPLAGWPTALEYAPITVTYQAGYETTPPELDAAVLLLIGHWYLHREAVSVGNSADEVPLAVGALTEPFRLPVLR